MLSTILARRSVSPKRLVPPAPGRDAVARMIAAAATAPDHGKLKPWRFIVIEDREALAGLFVEALRAREADPAPERVEREREKATQAPLTVVLVVRLGGTPEIPAEERWVSAGAALQNLLLTATELGYAGMILSGERTRDPVIRTGLGIGEDEAIAGFIALGTAKAPPAPRELPEPPMSVWPGTTTF